jgi:hypothetical protein
MDWGAAGTEMLPGSSSPFGRLIHKGKQPLPLLGVSDAPVGVQ